MYQDPIVEEVRQHRRAWAAKFGYDIEAMASDLKRQEAAARKRGAKFLLPRKRKASQVG